jgi:hypothetical protein
MAQPRAANGANVTLNVGVLLGLARLDVFKPNIAYLGACHQQSLLQAFQRRKY